MPTEITVRPWGMHPAAFEAYRKACKVAFGSRLSWPRIVQTVGNAPASAGFHAADGTFKNEHGKQEPYCAAVDLSVRGFLGIYGYKTEAIKWGLYCMAEAGFAGWYRYRRPFQTNRHIHSVFVGVHMKPVLQAQVIDFLNGRTGLVGHEHEEFWTAPATVDAHLKTLFLAHNPEAKNRV